MGTRPRASILIEYEHLQDSKMNTMAYLKSSRHRAITADRKSMSPESSVSLSCLKMSYHYILSKTAMLG